MHFNCKMIHFVLVSVMVTVKGTGHQEDDARREEWGSIPGTSDPSPQEGVSTAPSIDVDQSLLVMLELAFDQNMNIKPKAAKLLKSIFDQAPALVIDQVITKFAIKKDTRPGLVKFRLEMQAHDASESDGCSRCVSRCIATATKGKAKSNAGTVRSCWSGIGRFLNAAFCRRDLKCRTVVEGLCDYSKYRALTVGRSVVLPVVKAACMTSAINWLSQDENCMDSYPMAKQVAPYVAVFAIGELIRTLEPQFTKHEVNALYRFLHNWRPKFGIQWGRPGAYIVAREGEDPRGAEPVQATQETDGGDEGGDEVREEVERGHEGEKLED